MARPWHPLRVAVCFFHAGLSPPFHCWRNVLLHRQSPGAQAEASDGQHRRIAFRNSAHQAQPPIPGRGVGDFTRSPACHPDLAAWRQQLPDALAVDQNPLCPIASEGRALEFRARGQKGSAASGNAVSGNIASATSATSPSMSGIAISIRSSTDMWRASKTGAIRPITVTSASAGLNRISISAAWTLLKRTAENLARSRRRRRAE